jgi:hypothetical protein
MTEIKGLISSFRIPPDIKITIFPDFREEKKEPDLGIEMFGMPPPHDEFPFGLNISPPMPILDEIFLSKITFPNIKEKLERAKINTLRFAWCSIFPKNILCLQKVMEKTRKELIDDLSRCAPRYDPTYLRSLSTKEIDILRKYYDIPDDIDNDSESISEYIKNTQYPLIKESLTTFYSGFPYAFPRGVDIFPTVNYKGFNCKPLDIISESTSSERHIIRPVISPFSKQLVKNNLLRINTDKKIDYSIILKAFEDRENGYYLVSINEEELPIPYLMSCLTHNEIWTILCHFGMKKFHGTFDDAVQLLGVCYSEGVNPKIFKEICLMTTVRLIRLYEETFPSDEKFHYDRVMLMWSIMIPSKKYPGIEIDPLDSSYITNSRIDCKTAIKMCLTLHPTSYNSPYRIIGTHSLTQKELEILSAFTLGVENHMKKNGISIPSEIEGSLPKVEKYFLELMKESV